MNIRKFKLEEDPLSRNAQSVSKNYHEDLLLMNFLQTRPRVKNMNIKYYDIYYTNIKNRYDNEIVNENIENDYINFNDFITPNHNISIKPLERKLKWRNLKSHKNHLK